MELCEHTNTHAYTQSDERFEKEKQRNRDTHTLNVTIVTYSSRTPKKCSSPKYETENERSRKNNSESRTIQLTKPKE